MHFSAQVQLGSNYSCYTNRISTFRIHCVNVRVKYKGMRRGGWLYEGLLFDNYTVNHGLTGHALWIHFYPLLHVIIILERIQGHWSAHGPLESALSLVMGVH